MKYKYYIVYEYSVDALGEEQRRRVYTFDNEPAAHELVEFLSQKDFMITDLAVEEHEVTT